MSSLLIVDRDDALRSEVARFLHSLGHGVQEAQEYPEALRLAGEQAFDLLICQVPAGGSPGELLRAARARNPGAALIVQSEPEAEGEGELALQEGAAGLLAKPYSLPELNFQVRRALEGGARGRGAPGLVERYQNVYRPYSFIGESPGIKKDRKSVV